MKALLNAFSQRVSIISMNLNKTKLPATKGFTIVHCRLWNMVHGSNLNWNRCIRNLCSCEKKAWKKFRLVRDSNPSSLRYRCSALPIKLTIKLIIQHIEILIFDIRNNEISMHFYTIQNIEIPIFHIHDMEDDMAEIRNFSLSSFLSPSDHVIFFLLYKILTIIQLIQKQKVWNWLQKLTVSCINRKQARVILIKRNT